MKSVVKAGSFILIRIPKDASRAFLIAARILKKEITERIDLQVLILQGDTSSSAEASLSIRLETLESFSEEDSIRVEPPIRLLPFPDYSEHINLRIQEGRFPEILVCCGSENSLIHGVGKLWRFFRFYEECFEWEMTSADFQPLNPRRGCFFRGDIQKQWTRDYWKDIVNQQALWGDNLIGFEPTSIVNEIGETISDCRLSFLISGEPGERLTEKRAENVIYLIGKERFDELTGENGFKSDSIKNINNRLQNKELWLNMSGLDEEKLSDLLDFLHSGEDSFVQCLVCDPRDSMFERVQREMPLSLQFVSWNCLTGNSVFSLRGLIRKHTDIAPLTYGALAVSAGPGNELARFFWAMLGWLPMPILEEMAEQYGNWYCGARAAGSMRDAILSLESDRGRSMKCLEAAESAVPGRMRERAKLRIDEIRSFINLKHGVSGK